MNTEEKEMTIAKWHEKGKKTGKKYELVEDDCIEYDGHKLYRIRALNYVLVPGFINEHIYPGALGGYVASEKNLVQTGNCWVCDGAKVYGNAIVKDNAVVGKDAVISENAVILENAYVIEKSVVEGNCIVKGHAGVSQHSVLRRNCILDDYAFVECSILAGNIFLGNEVHVIGSKLEGQIEIAKEYDKNEDYRLTIRQSTLEGHIVVKNSDFVILDSFVKDVSVENVCTLVFENSVVEQSDFEKCEEIYVKDCNHDYADCGHDRAISDLTLINLSYYSNSNGDICRFD